MIATGFTGISYYRDAQGYLIPVFAGGFHHYAASRDFIIGLYMNNLTYAIYDVQRRQILIDRDDNEVVLMTEALHERFDEFFVRLRPPTPRRSRPAAPDQRRRNNPHFINGHQN